VTIPYLIDTIAFDEASSEPLQEQTQDPYWEKIFVDVEPMFHE